jgi:hypothetical protein
MSSALQFEVKPENFHPIPEAPEELRGLSREALSSIARSAVGRAALVRNVPQGVSALGPPMPCRLTVEGPEERVWIDLLLQAFPSETALPRLRTPEGVHNVAFDLTMDPDGRANLSLNVEFVGLPVEAALRFARFLRALYRGRGVVWLHRLESDDEGLELFDLPLPLNPAGADDVENRVRFLEVLNEIGRETGAGFVYPSEVTDEDLRILGRVLEVVRKGWVVDKMIDFSLPMGPEALKNTLEVVKEEGNVLKAMALTSEYERVEIFGVWLDLGPNARYIFAARLVTSLDDMERWLSSKSTPDASFDTRWVPVDDAPLHAFYYEWPKPSPERLRRDLEAFEEEYGMTTDEFRMAWERGDRRVRILEDADVWASLADAERAMKEGGS